MVIINSVFWFYNFETLKLGDNKQDVIIYGVIIDRSDCIKYTILISNANSYTSEYSIFLM